MMCQQIFKLEETKNYYKHMTPKLLIFVLDIKSLAFKTITSCFFRLWEIERMQKDGWGLKIID